MEGAVWTSYRTLQERAVLARRLAQRMRERGQPRSAASFERQTDEALEHAAVVRGVLLKLEPMGDADGAAADA
jgi:two-component system, chemotaxis family, protein-glutamate methylesterase/glutaminase